MMKKTMIISAADAAYFPLLKGLVVSIADRRPDDRIEVGVLDLGMTESQLGELKAMGCRVVAGEWDFESVGPERPPRGFQAMMARCHLPRYFPDAEICIWIDADAWLADWQTIRWLEAVAASTRMVAIVPELHRAYASNYSRGKRDDPTNRARLFEYTRAYGEATAERMMYLPTINTGVLPSRATHPHGSAGASGWSAG